jgi:hypothetical protein
MRGPLALLLVTVATALGLFLSSHHGAAKTCGSGTVGDDYGPEMQQPAEFRPEARYDDPACNANSDERVPAAAVALVAGGTLSVWWARRKHPAV